MAYKRKTVDEFQVHGCYEGEWEEVTCADTRKEARKLLKEYRENETGTSFKLVKKRVKIEPMAVMAPLTLSVYNP